MISQNKRMLKVEGTLEIILFKTYFVDMEIKSQKVK